ncbi:hypothetical protein DID88_007822 [Monilinia fructigena]|uniref:Uncharacterized protein n=1 Tax=Monilinia fructigena TaxID=38457 RepID=A0A395J3K0_9HELO|nr:hypothetical protein DID88_007822 [Monilinia fructigena]
MKHQQSAYILYGTYNFQKFHQFIQYISFNSPNIEDFLFSKFFFILNLNKQSNFQLFPYSSFPYTTTSSASTSHFKDKTTNIVFPIILYCTTIYSDF